MPILDPTVPEDVQLIRDIMGPIGDMYADAELINETLLVVTWGQMTARYPDLAEETDPDTITVIRTAQALMLASRAVETGGSLTGGTMRLGDMTISGGSADADIWEGWMREAWALLASLYPGTVRAFVGFGLAHGRRGGRDRSVVDATDRPWRGW